jgi:hypothetical protein
MRAFDGSGVVMRAFDGSGVVMRAFEGNGVLMRSLACGAFDFTWLAGGVVDGARSDVGVTRVPERNSGGKSLARSPSSCPGAADPSCMSEYFTVASSACGRSAGYRCNSRAGPALEAGDESSLKRTAAGTVSRLVAPCASPSYLRGRVSRFIRRLSGGALHAAEVPLTALGRRDL